MILEAETPRIFKPLLSPSRDKAIYGGRSSMKSHFFGTRSVVSSVKRRGTRIVCIREVQKSLKESAKRLIELKIESLKAPGFRVLNDEIVTPGGGIIIFTGMNDHSAESIKSLEAFDISWVEEAQTLSERSLMILRPTIRKEGSERWWSWNPRKKSDPVDAMFRGNNPDVKNWTPPPDSIIIESNWRHNPWWSSTLEADRRYDELNSPDTYQHVWEGDYIGVQKGAYFASQLAAARREGRIGRMARDQLLSIQTIWDIGGTGARADARAIWVAQFIGREIRVLNYRETVGQELSEDVKWLRDNGYEGCHCILPHDGATFDRVSRVSYESALKDAGFKVQVIDNQGAGAASLRIEAARRLFPRIWFNEERCQAGLDALGWYHEKRDDIRQIGLGPEHDWSSHGADAFGLMCVAYEEPRLKAEEAERPPPMTLDPAEYGTAWMGN